MSQLEEIEAIKQLKYRYFRFLDMKLYRELADLFTQDGSTAYDNGRYSYQGREQIFSFMDESMGKPQIYTSHQAHHPEITLLDDCHATGSWHFEDTVHMMEHQLVIFGAGIYWDEYLKVGGEWKFQHTGYERLWVRQEVLPENSSRTVRGMYDPEERKLSRARPKRKKESGFFPE